MSFRDLREDSLKEIIFLEGIHTIGYIKHQILFVFNEFFLRGEGYAIII